MKKKLIYIFGGLIAFFFIICLIAPTTDQVDIQDIEQSPLTEASTVEEVDVLNTEIEILNGESKSSTPTQTTSTSLDQMNAITYYQVVSVVDGDTIKISMGGKTETLRLIGMDTPETVDPRKEVQCFGIEASNKAKELLSGKKVQIETDPSQGGRDIYNRMLAYIVREDGLFFNKYMIEQGYAHEYTYNTPYKYQEEFKNAQKQAQANKSGLWSPDTCNGNTTTPATTTSTTSTPTTSSSDSCTIKGNINSKKEKIYHVDGCGSYNQTVIDEGAGEKWFCSEQEALDSGWRKALNC